MSKFFVWFRKLKFGYREIFSIGEIESSVVLQWVMGALILSSFISFFGWANDSSFTKEAFLSQTHTCWPYFQSCGEYYFLSTLPYGYSQPALYTGLFGILILAVMFMRQRRWVIAHLCLLVVFLFKTFVVFVYAADFGKNYDYYDIVVGVTFLLLPHKLFFTRVSFVMLYFLAATSKFHESWIVGTYFTSLQLGLPIFSNTVTPFITNFVIGLQTVGAWFLLSANKMHQRIAFGFFLFFHFYSGLLVFYRYMTTSIPLLIILFGPLNTVVKTPLTKKSLFGWSFFALLIVFQLVPYFIEGDQKMTQEGNRYGLYMFDANHQCISNYEIKFTDGRVEANRVESFVAQQRCNPYNSWFYLKRRCLSDSSIVRASFTFDHSINGGPFYRIVDTANACELKYNAFSHNEWILLPPSQAEVIGYPVKNIYYY